MKMNAAMWIGFAGAIIGCAAALFAGFATGVGIVGIFIVVFIALFFGIFYKLLIGPALRANRIRKTGYPGKARIISVKDTGITINNNPVAKLEVEVRDNLGQRYTTFMRVMVSRINPMAYTPGMEIPVKIDPVNKENVVPDTEAAATMPTEAAVKSELEKMQEENNALMISGTPARAIVKRYNWLGTYVNGNNPYVELELEVLPEHSVAFSGTAKGVISEAAVHKYQPGCEIYVKYDLYDNSKIVLDHSK